MALAFLLFDMTINSEFKNPLFLAFSIAYKFDPLPDTKIAIFIKLLPFL